MQILGKDKVIFSFNRDNPFAYSVADGETFWVETDDCYSGQIQDEKTLRTDIDISIMDCAVGPIEVRSAKTGDVLKIDILAIETADHGVMVTTPGLGVERRSGHCRRRSSCVHGRWGTERDWN